MLTMSPYNEIALILLTAVLVGMAGFKLRQPLIICFLLAGILVGPSGLQIIGGHHDIALLAEIGISLLLFVVGLRLDLMLIRTVGPVVLATGLGQILFTSLIGCGLCLLFGMNLVTALYVSVALTFSSTIIIVKLLSDKKEIDALHGRIAVGFLIVQDIVAIIFLIALTAFGGGLGEGQVFLQKSLWILGKGLILGGSVVVLMRWVLPSLLRYLAHSQELLVVFAITWAIVLAAVADMLGFSKEVGAFLAGISLASAPQRNSIGARLVTLRDFLLLFFFIDLGARLEIHALGDQIGTAAVLSFFVLIGNPLIVMAIMGFMGYRKRTGFLCGLTVAQISEFSLILTALGVSLGHINSQAMNLVTLVGLITILASTYMILYSGGLYQRLGWLLSLFERRHPHREPQNEGFSSEDPSIARVILFGLGNYGREIATHLRARGRHVLAVDFDPTALAEGHKQGFDILYGDAEDPEILSQLPLAQARWVVSSVRNFTLNLTLLSLLKEAGFTGRTAVAAGSPAEAELLRKADPLVVLEPFHDAAEQAAEILTSAVHCLPGLTNWPISVREIVLRPGSVLAGQRLNELTILQETEASILAVSRAGEFHFNPDSEFKLYPGDRLVLSGRLDSVTRAASYMDTQIPRKNTPADWTLSVAELNITENSPLAGNTLAGLCFRQTYAASIIGIQRGTTKITLPKGPQSIEPGDRLIVVGSHESINRLKGLDAV